MPPATWQFVELRGASWWLLPTLLALEKQVALVKKKKHLNKLITCLGHLSIGDVLFQKLCLSKNFVVPKTYCFFQPVWCFFLFDLTLSPPRRSCHGRSFRAMWTSPIRGSRWVPWIRVERRCSVEKFQGWKSESEKLIKMNINMVTWNQNNYLIIVICSCDKHHVKLGLCKAFRDVCLLFFRPPVLLESSSISGSFELCQETTTGDVKMKETPVFRNNQDGFLGSSRWMLYCSHLCRAPQEFQVLGSHVYQRIESGRWRRSVWFLKVFWMLFGCFRWLNVATRSISKKKNVFHCQKKHQKQKSTNRFQQMNTND